MALKTSVTHILLWISVATKSSGSDMSFEPGVTQYIDYSPVTLTGEIHSPGYPSLNFTTAATSTIQIRNLPNQRTWVNIVYLPAFAGTEPCNSDVPFTVGNSTKDVILSGGSCIFFNKEREMRRIITTADIILRLPIINNTEVAFKLTYSVSANLNTLAPMGGIEKKINATNQNTTSYVISHDQFNFGTAYLQHTNYSLTLVTPPTATSVELTFIQFIIGLVRVRDCQMEPSRNNVSNDLFAIYNGDSILYACGGGIIWGSDTKMTFNLSSPDNSLKFMLHSRSNSTQWHHGFLIKYQISACNDVPYSVAISRQGNTNTDFTVICEDGQILNHQCVGETWMPADPICYPQTTTRRTPSTDISIYVSSTRQNNLQTGEEDNTRDNNPTITEGQVKFSDFPEEATRVIWILVSVVCLLLVLLIVMIIITVRVLRSNNRDSNTQIADNEVYMNGEEGKAPVYDTIHDQDGQAHIYTSLDHHEKDSAAYMNMAAVQSADKSA